MFRTKKVAAIFDFDKTLSPDYMQSVIFKHYGVDEDEFWKECQTWSAENKHLIGSSHSELSYMNTLLRYVKSGAMRGLSNAKLAELGENIELYAGVPYVLNTLFNMGVEIYIVSSGIRTMLRGLENRIQRFARCPEFKIHGIYGGGFRENDEGEISHIASVVSPLDKLKAIYEISKGCEFYGIDVTTSVPAKDRRIPLEFMIYVGDGPSDIFAFNLIHDNGGYTLGVFDPSDPVQFQQIEQIREDDRLDLVAVADYRSDSTATCWMVNKAKELLFKSSEAYEFRQDLADLRTKKIGHVHPWDIDKYGGQNGKKQTQTET